MNLSNRKYYHIKKDIKGFLYQVPSWRIKFKFVNDCIDDFGDTDLGITFHTSGIVLFQRIEPSNIVVSV